MRNPNQVFGQTQGTMQYTWKEEPEPRELKNVSGYMKGTSSPFGTDRSAAGLTTSYMDNSTRNFNMTRSSNLD